jgi:hypothetical protein
MDIETRLQALEKSNRRYRLAFLSLVVVLAAFMLLGSGGQVPDTIQARKFEVLDKNGKILVRLSELDGLGSVTTYTPAGEILVDLVPTKSGAGGIVLYNGKGKQTMVMTDVTGGGGSVQCGRGAGDAAEVQHRSDTTCNRDSRAARRRAGAQVSAMGAHSVLGEGSGYRAAPDQCQGREPDGETGISECVSLAQVFGSCGWVLRMDGDRRQG